MTKLITIEYYTLNVKVLPVLPNQDDNVRRYETLLTGWFENNYKILTKGDGKHYYSLRELSSIEDGKMYYGVIGKFFSLDNFDFIDSETNRPIPQPVPANVEARVNEYEFVFIPEKHRMAVIKKGKINEHLKRTGAPLKQIQEVVKIGFESGLLPNQSSLVEIVSERYIFEEILNSNLKDLKFRISYTNDDLLPEGKALMDRMLKNDNIGQFFGSIKPDNSGVIDTSLNGITRGILELANENGTIKAHIENENGVKTINSADNPEIKTETIQSGPNRFVTFLNLIYTELIRSFNNG